MGEKVKKKKINMEIMKKRILISNKKRMKNSGQRRKLQHEKGLKWKKNKQQQKKQAEKY